MTRAQFLNDLYRRLHGLTQEQAEQHLTYYAEMLNDRMEEGMTEEEAVASMEPLDIIAQRILQDEGVPDAAAAQPPQYPDLPKTSGSQFTKAPDMPKKISGKKAAMVILWIVAVVMAISAAGRWLYARSGAYRTAAPDATDATDASEAPLTEETLPIDYGLSEEDWEEYIEEYIDGLSDFEFEYLEDLWGLYIGPDGIQGNNFSVGPDGIFASDGEHSLYIGPEGITFTETSEDMTDDLIGTRYSYEGDVYRLDTEDISKINIKWTTGVLMVQGWDEGYIQFQEFSNTKLKQSQKLDYKVDGNILNISSKTGLDKGLIVRVPTHIENLNTESSTATVCWDQLAAESAHANTSSGDIIITNSAFNELAVHASSGDVTLRSVTTVVLEEETSSGDASLDAVTAEQLDVSASSGNISGVIAGDYANIRTTSGNIDINAGFTEALVLESSSGTVKAAFPAIPTEYVEVDTSSGDVILRLLESWDFSLEFDSSNGYLDRGPFYLYRTNGVYITEGTPMLRIEVETTSGDLRLEAV